MWTSIRRTPLCGVSRMARPKSCPSMVRAPTMNIRMFGTRPDWTNVPSSYVEGEVHISEKCAETLNKLIKQEWIKDKESAKLRVEVRPGGCSGFEYEFSVDDSAEVEEDDRLFTKNGARVVIDKESLRHLSGSVIDYKEEMIKSSFTISSNPNSVQNCSCGTSFASKVV
ncbi:iron-sulfur cluster assembly 2 protein, mitochondrial-like isoform 2 [Planoprotostelium fungivorum]|uniref:Iron-sulfur cluster assembly 2 protein, mitochondrial-like isoform 2 n=1 Tax=Planoprotostelium fungivorum TaxID=1890364 RepID=A0A2P6N5I6_9EUKA|nr:iron-sulfur cluster assembly 2 protein, mitochondrial-like isoform 2 [Planoprotostelium fungivorum]